MNRLALITGASAGIGAAFARAYAARGFDVALTARRAARLETLAAEIRELSSGKAIVCPGDLADAGTPARLLASIGRPVDILINNAGYGLAGAFRSTQWTDQDAFIRVMAAAPSELAHRALPNMVARGYGRVINVASLAGLLPAGQGHTLYAAVKAYLIKFSESLHSEMADKGVFVTALCPGLTWSEFHDANGTRARLSRVPRIFWQTAEHVATAAIRANEANRVICIPGAANMVLAGLARLAPESLGLAVVQRAAARFRIAD